MNPRVGPDDLVVVVAVDHDAVQRVEVELSGRRRRHEDWHDAVSELKLFLQMTPINIKCILDR